MSRAPACDVALYTHSFDGGGAERVMVQLANHWAEAGARVAMIVNLAEGPLREDLSPAVSLIALGQRRGLLAGPWLAAALRRLAAPALVSAMTEQNIAACFAQRLARARGRLVTVEHNYMSDALASGPWLRGALLKALMRFTYPAADANATVSRESARDLDELLGLPSGRAQVLYNPIWPMVPTLGRTPAETHRWLGDATPTMLAVGRLVAQKNHANLLEALAIVRQTRSARLLLLGEGPLREDLEAQAARLGLDEAVDFLGFRRDVADFLAHADLFVLSSDREGLPLSLLEALRMGVPVVSTDCRSGPREILDDGRVGALVPVGDPAALAEAILATLAAPPSRELLTARAADFDTTAVARRYEALLFPGFPPPWRA